MSRIYLDEERRGGCPRQTDLQVQKLGGMREFTCLEPGLAATSSQVLDQESEE